MRADGPVRAKPYVALIAIGFAASAVASAGRTHGDPRQNPAGEILRVDAVIVPEPDRFRPDTDYPSNRRSHRLTNVKR